jgi:sugar phosphate isomerase/epimerase
MHARLSLHQICFGDIGVADFLRQCQELGAGRATLTSPALLAPDGLDQARMALDKHGIRLQSIAHLFTADSLSVDPDTLQGARDTLYRLIDNAAELGASSIYMLTGGRGELSWDEAADCFCKAIQPCRERAAGAGIKLAIENASALYADLHIAHTLADTLSLAEKADIDICIELFFCWAEAGLPGLFRRAIPRCRLVQVSDYVYGDRALPARAVPGDGALPLATLLAELENAGYRGAYELELLGPRIDAEGHAAAARRAAASLGHLLQTQT